MRFVIILKIIFVILLIILFDSCSNKLGKANEKFLQEYGDDVDRINQNRIEVMGDDSLSQDNSQNWSGKASQWDDSATNFGVAGTNHFKSAQVDTSGLKFFKPNQEEFTPDMQTLLEGKRRSLPSYIFDISYNLFNYPASYGRSKVSFDDIVIPVKDAFGIKSQLSEKNYILVGKGNLQENIDHINSITDYQDRNISKILIKERKELKAKRSLMPI